MQGPSLVQRGLLLLGGLTALLAIVGIVFWGPLANRGSAVDVTPPGGQPSAPGWEIRYNAAVALARRGSKEVPLDTLLEMMDEAQQLRNFREKINDNNDIADEAAARRAVINGLKAVAEWHKHPDAGQAIGADNVQLQKVYEAVDQLAQNPNPAIKKEAESARASYRKS